MMINQYYREMNGKDVLFTKMHDFSGCTRMDDAWKNRNKVKSFIKKETEVILDGNRYFKVIGIPEYPEGTVFQPYFTLVPIGPTLQEYEKEYSTFSEKNRVSFSAIE